MATLASVFGKFLSRAGEQERTARRPPKAGTRLRPFANEDIYLFVKQIDNSRVVRAADPESGRRAWKQIGTMAAAVAVIVAVLMPSVYSTLAGYQIERLRKEGEKLAAQRAELELREAALLSPERMRELARVQEFIDPAPEQVVHLDKPGEEEFATAAAPGGLRVDAEPAAQAK